MTSAPSALRLANFLTDLLRGAGVCTNHSQGRKNTRARYDFSVDEIPYWHVNRRAQALHRREAGKHGCIGIACCIKSFLGAGCPISTSISSAAAPRGGCRARSRNSPVILVSAALADAGAEVSAQTH